MRRYSNNIVASGLSIFLRTASSILGRLPSYACGFHPIFIKRSAIWSRLFGLNGMVLVLLPVLTALSARTCFNLFSLRTSLRPPLVAAVYGLPFTSTVQPFGVFISSVADGNMSWSSSRSSARRAMSSSVRSLPFLMSKGQPFISCPSHYQGEDPKPSSCVLL